MILRTAVKRSYSDLDAEAWGRLSGRRPFASTRWLAYCERVFAHDHPFYILVEEEGSLIGAAVFWLRRRPSLPDVPQAVEWLLAWLFRFRPLLICEIPIAGSCGLLLPAEPEQRDRTLHAILEQASKLGEEYRASIIVCGYLERSLSTGAVWPEAYEEVRLFPGTEMDLTGVKDYSDYTARLSKKQRKNIRRNRDAALAEGTRIMRRTMVDTDLAVRLANRVARRHGGYLPAEIRRIFACAGMVDSAWLTAESAGSIVGFDLLLGDQGAWKVQATGSDYSADRLYFLLSDEDIRFAIEKSADRLIAGTHLYKVKERLGYQVADDGFVRFDSSSLAGRLVRATLRLRQEPP